MAYPERIVPEETGPGVLAIHLKRYEFARGFCGGADVLDAACGVGYGSAYIADVARRVVGVDVSEEAIAYAQAHYARPNVEFRVGDALELDLPDASFDVVCSFETIEHVPDQERLLRQFARVVRPTGVVVVSTPNARETTRTPENPFHHVELSHRDFEALLRRHFADVEILGQRRLETTRHRMLKRLDVLGLRRRVAPRVLRRASAVLGSAPMAEVTADGLAIDTADLDGSTELVAVCRRPLARSVATLAAQIREKVTPDGVATAVVAVDGPGGAGKSSFAERLAKELGCAPVIHTDDFASWDEPLEWWPELVEKALAPLAAGMVARYRPSSWGGPERDPVEIRPGGFVVLEGVSASRAAFRPYLTYSIWVETPRETRLKRGLDRDGEEARAQWEEWMAAEDAYIARERPREQADAVVPGDQDLGS